jgi:hypothetical protein
MVGVEEVLEERNLIRKSQTIRMISYVISVRHRVM